MAVMEQALDVMGYSTPSEFLNILKPEVVTAVLAPKKVKKSIVDGMADKLYDFPPCESLDFFANDAVVMGYYHEKNEKGLCVAFDTSTRTFAIAHSGIIKPFKILGIIHFTPTALGFSLDAGLEQESGNTMWDGLEDSVADMETKTMNGHVVVAGDAEIGLKIGNQITGTITAGTCDQNIDAIFDNRFVSHQ